MKCLQHYNHLIFDLNFILFVISAVVDGTTIHKTTFENGFDQWTPQGQSWTIKTWQKVKAEFNQSSLALPDPPLEEDFLEQDSKKVILDYISNISFSILYTFEYSIGRAHNEKSTQKM